VLDSLAECIVLRGKVTDPGARHWALAVVFRVSGGDWFGGAQRLDFLAGVAAA
jgi:hypothetical protein